MRQHSLLDSYSLERNFMRTGSRIFLKEFDKSYTIHFLLINWTLLSWSIGVWKWLVRWLPVQTVVPWHLYPTHQSQKHFWDPDFAYIWWPQFSPHRQDGQACGKKNNVELFQLLSHTTHHTQLLDVGIFSPLHWWWSERSWKRLARRYRKLTSLGNTWLWEHWHSYLRLSKIHGRNVVSAHLIPRCLPIRTLHPATALPPDHIFLEAILNDLDTWRGKRRKRRIKRTKRMTMKIHQTHAAMTRWKMIWIGKVDLIMQVSEFLLLLLTDLTTPAASDKQPLKSSPPSSATLSQLAPHPILILSCHGWQIIVGATEAMIEWVYHGTLEINISASCKWRWDVIWFLSPKYSGLPYKVCGPKKEKIIKWMWSKKDKSHLNIFNND